MKIDTLELALCIEKLKEALTKASGVGTLTITPYSVKVVTHDNIHEGVEGVSTALSRETTD